MARIQPPKARRAARRALDSRLDLLREATRTNTATATPKGGWVRALRQSLGMSAAELGARMGVEETTVLRLERNETAGRVQLDTMRRAAEALDCDLICIPVPRQPLEKTVRQRAEIVARQLLGRVDHSMALEDQRVEDVEAAEQLAQLAAQLSDDPGLWRDQP